MVSSFSTTAHRVFADAMYLLILALGVAPTAVEARAANRTTINLLQPITGGNSIAIQPGLGTWFEYFGRAGQWLYNIAIGFCVLWVLIGGIQVMTSSDASDRRAKGFEKMKASILGVIILTFSGLILRTLNNLFFT